MRLSGTILVADDDREIRLGVADLLTPLGLEIVEAETGLDALSIASSRRFEAMVLDGHMPGCDGLEVLTRLPAELRIPCIFCTGEPSEGLERQVLEAGAFAFLTKPIQPSLLRTEVIRAVEQSLGLTN